MAHAGKEMDSDDEQRRPSVRKKQASAPGVARRRCEGW